MKPKSTYWIFIIYLIILTIAFFFSYDTVYKKHSSDVFYASIGLLTFTSIFYAFTISSGAELLKQIKKTYEDKKQRLLDIKLKNVVNSKKNTIFEEIEQIKNECENIDISLNYMDLNKWLFISVLSFMTSIGIFITTNEDIQKWAIFIQILSFWAGFFSTLIIVTIWFIANHNFSATDKK